MREQKLQSSQLFWLLLSLSFVRQNWGLEVTPNSECASLCIDNISFNPNNTLYSSTQKWDLICNDYEIDGPNQTVSGRKWKDCVSCESTSTATDSDSDENDTYWFLFNMKFTVDWCVFGYPDNNNLTAANQCADICGDSDDSTKKALTDRLLQTNATLQYQYCKDGNGAFSKTARSCMECLENVPNSKVLANYVNAMNKACQQKPSLGETIKLDFEVFPSVSKPTSTSSSRATVTVTSTPSSLSSAVPNASASTSISAVPTPSSSSHSSNSVKIGVGVGVGIGAIAVLIAISAFIFLRRGSERKQKELENETRTRLELEYQGRLDQKKAQDYRIHELGASHHVAEADSRRLDPIFMLESPPDSRSPQTSRSSATLGGPPPPAPNSPDPKPKKPERHGSVGTWKMYGNPPVPAKDGSRRDRV